MISTSNLDKKEVVEIICESFSNNPSVMASIKSGGNKQAHLRGLASYAFNTAKSRNGIHITSNRNGVAICYPYNYKKETLSDYWYQVKLVITSIGVRKLFEVLKREAFIKSKRPSSGDFLYFWFFGVKDRARGSKIALELKNEIFEKSRQLNLPIYLETSVLKNKNVYSRYGFEVYYEWRQNNGDTLWFMRKLTS